MTSTARSSLIGAGIGATVMFLADPNRGARRRALVRDKVVWATRKTRDGTGATWRDLRNRTAGLQARWRTSDDVDDVTLRERVRAALGRVISHPRSITVNVTSGWVTLTGDALESDVESIVSAASEVHGVEGVENNIRTHASADRIPMLQGESERPGQWRAWIGSGWSPTAKLIAGAGLGVLALAAWGSRERMAA